MSDVDSCLWIRVYPSSMAPLSAPGRMVYPNPPIQATEHSPRSIGIRLVQPPSRELPRLSLLPAARGVQVSCHRHGGKLSLSGSTPTSCWPQDLVLRSRRDGPPSKQLG